MNESADCRDNATDRSQSKAGALPRPLGSKERLKQALASFGIHPQAVIADREKDTRKGGCTLPRQVGSRNGLKFAVTRLNYDVAAARQGVAGIENQIQDDLLRLRLVDTDRAEIRIETKIERNVSADQLG
jgi:hypothetical protein